ncbi:MAG: bile acid:sodium symporter, partial [Candidatus Omnitrophica bacterium]|nr:bile acid:sodium symporter [Candidatus Omnitrophota bacterium]
TMLFLYAPLGGWLLGVNKMPIPWQTIVLSVVIYVGLPLFLGYHSRKWIIAKKGFKWFEEKFIHYLTELSIGALLVTLILLFSFKGDLIISQPQVIFLIAIPLFIQTCLIFVLTYAMAKWLRLSYRDAAPSALIGASNHFEVAIATSTILFGLSSGASLATVVGVLIEVPVMLMLVRVCLKTKRLFT